MTARAQMIPMEDDAETSDIDPPKRPTKERKGLSPKTEFILAWDRQIARDGGLSRRGGRVATFLAQELWKHPELEGRYYAKKSQAWFETKLGVSRPTIQKAFGDLVRQGHLEVVVRKGQGKANYYLPVIHPEEKAPAPIEESDPVARETIFDPGEATAAVIEAITDMAKTKIKALTEFYAGEITYLIDDPTSACFSHMPDLFQAFQSTFPQECQAYRERDAEVGFMELIGHGFPPIVLYQNALRYVREARESGQEIMAVEDWLTEKLADVRYL